MFWGLTPALDLQAELKENGKLPSEINILIVGGADCRHVLKTVARRYRHEGVKLNFFVAEAILEAVARQIFLLNVALQPEDELGEIQKTRYFMELYGNSLVRPAVAKFLKQQAMELVEMITDPGYMQHVMPFVKLELRFKERDYLENLFKFWCSMDEFDVIECWDRRMRKNLGIRYDNKMGAFEWDLHMRLHSVGGQQICGQEYTHWRATGVAFTWLESEVSKANRSLVCGVLPNGDKFAHYGFLGDMATGPFVCYGLECEDAEFLESTNGINSQRATDVTERNLRQIFHEIQHNDEYKHQKINERNMGATTVAYNDLKVVDGGAVHDIVRKKNKPCVNLEDVTINFVSINALKSFGYKEEFRDFFHLMYFGSTYLRYFDSEAVQASAAPKCLLIVENQIFVPSHRDKQMEELENQMKTHLEPLKSKVDLDFNVKKDPYARFLLKVEL